MAHIYTPLRNDLSSFLSALEQETLLDESLLELSEELDMLEALRLRELVAFKETFLSLCRLWSFLPRRSLPMTNAARWKPVERMRSSTIKRLRI